MNKISAIVLGTVLSCGIAVAQNPPAPQAKTLTVDQMHQLDDLKTQYLDLNRKIAALPGYKELAEKQAAVTADFRKKAPEFCGPGAQIVEPTGNNDWACTAPPAPPAPVAPVKK